jgi:hypothetical protein
LISQQTSKRKALEEEVDFLKESNAKLEGELRRVKKKYGEDQVRVISNNTADLNHEENKYSESLAKDIAFCAGDFDFAAAIFSDIPTYSEKLKGLSRGWEFGSWGLYFVTGYEMEAAKIFAKGKKEVKFNEWLVRTEGANPDKLGDILDNELTPRLKHCSSMEEIVIESQDVVRKLLFGRRN